MSSSEEDEYILEDEEGKSEGESEGEREVEREGEGEKESEEKKEEVVRDKKKKKELTPGVVYLSRIPPFMRPRKIRHLLSKYGTIGRIYLQPEGM